MPNLYIYPPNANPAAPPPALLGPINGTMTANMWTVPAPNNNANLHIGNQYVVTFLNPLGPHSPPTTVTCNAVAPPNYIFIVPNNTKADNLPKDTSADSTSKGGTKSDNNNVKV